MPYPGLLDSDVAIVDGELVPRCESYQVDQLAIANGDDISSRADPLPVLQHVPERSGDNN